MIHQGRGCTRQDSFALPTRPVVMSTAQIWIIRALAIVPATLLLLVVVAQPYVDPRWLFLDALTAAERSGDCCHIYYGLVAKLGGFIWVGTGVVCLFAAALLYGDRAAPRSWWLVALAAGLFSGWLGIDDAFSVHDTVLPRFGIPASATQGAYAITALVYALAAARTLMRGDAALFLTGCICLALSLFVDQTSPGSSWRAIALEDGFKFLGICCWSVFHLYLMFGLLRTQPAQHAREDNSGTRPHAATAITSPTLVRHRIAA